MDFLNWLIEKNNGAFRSGHNAYEICKALQEKQKINTERNWKVLKSDEPSFHEK